jgi:futalosine hydrolase
VTARRRSPRLLVLVPTPVEAALLGLRVDPKRAALVCTGVGLAAAGAAASRAIRDHAPRAVLLVGIAGTLDVRRAPIGAAVDATHVGCDGIGAGEGRGFVSFTGPALELDAGASSLRGAKVARGEILSVAAAAGSAAMAKARRARHPQALAEEMEGYAVALAARLAEVPLTIVRGISNVAGDREPSRWKWETALAACRRLAERWLGAHHP